MRSLFRDRRDAGKKLARTLAEISLDNPVILALPRGGVTVADEVAQILEVPIDVVIARKIGAPGQPEFGIGAICEDEIPSFNPTIAHSFLPDSLEVQHIIKHEKSELKRRVELYRQGKPLPNMEGKSIVVIDDGYATGVTAIAAGKFLRTLGPKKLILAVPVGPEDIHRANDVYDEVICLHVLPNLSSIGLWYDEFGQVEDEEVLDILSKYH